MKAFTLISSLFLFPLLVFAQIEVSVFAGPTYSFYDAPDSRNEIFTITSETPDGYFRQRATTIFSQNLMDRFGADGGFQLAFGLKEKWKFTSGLSLAYRSFDHDAAHKTTVLDPNAEPTFVEVNRSGSGGSFTCHTYTRNDNSDPSKKGKHDILYLGVPLQLEYAVIPNKLRVFGGAQVMTLLFTSVYEVSYDFNIESETIGNGTTYNTCTTNIDDENNHSGQQFNTLQIQARAGVSLQVFEKIALEAAFTRGLTNIFVAPEYQEYNYQNAEAYFQTVSLLVRYRL